MSGRTLILPNEAATQALGVASPAEAYEVGLDEALDEGAVVIEWPERLGGRLPGDRLDVVIAPSQEGETRAASLAGHGAWKGRELGSGS